MQEKINLNEENFEKDEKVGFTDQTNELLPKIELSDFQVHLPQFIQNFFDTSFSSLPQFQPLEIEDPRQTVARKEFKNPSEENTQKLQLIPNELWLTIFWYLDTKALVQVMISYKFLGEITNDKEIRNTLGQDREWWYRRVRLQYNQPYLFFPEVKSIDTMFERNSKLFTTLPLDSKYKDFLKEEKELYQPGDNGFVMKK